MMQAGHSNDAPLLASSAPASIANTILSQLLADDSRFSDSASVGRALSQKPDHPHPKLVTSQARRIGQIFGVWDGAAYRYPKFQFEINGLPRLEVAELVALLPSDSDSTNRNACLWLYAPDLALDDRTPAEIFPEDPARVITMLRSRRDGGEANS